jgi:hypothetical protein
VTVEGQARSALVAVRAAEDEAEFGLAGVDSSPATIRVDECLLRGGGDLVDVTAGRRLDLDLDQVVVSTGGSLVHGHGLPRGQSSEPLKVGLRRVTARVAGGWSGSKAPWESPSCPSPRSPPATRSSPRAPGAGPCSASTARTPSTGSATGSAGTGTASPTTRSRPTGSTRTPSPGPSRSASTAPTGTLAVGTREDAPIHGDLKFSKPWDPDRHSWSLTKDDVHLAPESPALASGADLDVIPDPPQVASP